jgi:hypothetical protein
MNDTVENAKQKKLLQTLGRQAAILEPSLPIAARLKPVCI